ncbi:MAG: magnesium transporter [Phenylobacterium sp.]|uniref:Magnesium transporter MgtE n=1 Tax=Phenylobacterium ferrooxidans TaxID=2982689 RepID=A0ABW6CRM1_9CAUL|nr:magnesium transporter [Phenylobacterium sp.]MDO8912422.1 magnesium transporter [Phenylobacterium sp.]MDP2011638.1 magnesium transporter [Phenylobacterium sp.]MDP3099803.1 magnesium transporter [Phenylobacterium sp.]MDP3632075.1 magnesium transporter [Phenylobacterium sp.]MDP3868713.1 magnesium transporter [Phenylobacterium sp.]
MSRDTEHPKDDVLDLRTSRESLTSAEVEDLEDLALGEDYALNPDFVAMVVDAIDRGDAERLRELLAALHPADVADLMGFLSSDYRSEVVAHLDPEALAEILSELDTEIREDVLEHVPYATLAKALGEMDSDDAVDVVDDLEDDKRAQVLAAMPEMERSAIESSLAYEDETAGRLMQREVVWAPQFWTVGQTIEHFLKEGDELPELFFDVYVVDPSHRPVGAVPVSHLLRTRRDAPLAQVMEAITEIPVQMDQEEVAYIFDKYHLISAPVVEPGGRLVGQITVDDIVGVIQDETEEDILALAGVTDAGRDAGVLGIVRSRLPWLILNLLTATVAVSVIAAFQDEITKLVTLAIIMPIVASLGGNAGTQTLAVAVRALANRELNASNAMRIFLREVSVGVLNGATLAAIMSVAVFLWFHDLRLSITVALALIVNVSIAAVVGTLVPLTLDRLGRDPAVSSSVFVTFVTDFMGFLSFLGLAAVILL